MDRTTGILLAYYREITALRRLQTAHMEAIEDLRQAQCLAEGLTEEARELLDTAAFHEENARILLGLLTSPNPP